MVSGARTTGAAAILALLLAAGCLRETAFVCATDAECTPDGACEATGYCSFPDDACAGGRRYGELAGGLANACVEAAATPDAPPPRCVGYAPLGTLAHRYRAIPAATNHAAQRTACAADGGYLAIPDDAEELAAVLDLAGGGAWIGVDDLATEGSYVTVRGQPASFLPWSPGEPTGPAMPAEDCVRISGSTRQLRDEACGNAYRAVCECEP